MSHKGHCATVEYEGRFIHLFHAYYNVADA
jgi:hypothetical protein